MTERMNKEKFQNIIYTYYRAHKRDFPWRQTTDPYAILVSEIMLQQTQTERVVPKYLAFLERFPNFESLAKAPLADVLKLWSGLGYNRRAKYLHETAKILNEKLRASCSDVLIRHYISPEYLQTLPGIGKYTAGAITVFVRNIPLVFVETNIRRVFIHCFFSDTATVTDKEIIPVIEQTLDSHNPREWYYALMDYGSMLGKNRENPNRKSKHYTKQSKFEGSRRQLRGKLMRVALEKGSLDLAHKELKGYDIPYIEEVWSELKNEGLVG